MGAIALTINNTTKYIDDLVPEELVKTNGFILKRYGPLIYVIGNGGAGAGTVVDVAKCVPPSTG
jgi:hypothetical protein